MKFYIEKYAGFTFRGKYMVRNHDNRTTTYLCNDGVVREWALTEYGDGSITMYCTKESAERALIAYENKGEVMRLNDLVTGMMVEVDGRVLKVIRGTGIQDVVFVSESGAYMTSNRYYNADLSGKWDTIGNITKVWTQHPIGRLLKDFEPTTQLLWERPVSDTVMTISELEKKYGIPNLKIVKENR